MVLAGLGADYTRSVGSGSGEGLPVRTSTDTLPDQHNNVCSQILGRAPGNRGGGAGTNSQRSDKEGSTSDGAIHKQTLRDSKEGWITLASSKSETPQSVHGKTPLQNGGNLQGEGVVKRRKLDVLGGLERCIPFSTCGQASQEVSECTDDIFTKLLHPVMAHLRFQGLRMMIYLDDILIMAEDRETLQLQVHQTVALLEKLGFLVNRPKSVLEPSHQITYLGLLVDATRMKLSLTNEKAQGIMEDCKQVLAKGTITAQELASVIGRMSAARLAVLPVPLYTHHLQHQLIQTLRRSSSFKTMVALCQEAKGKLQWWIHHLHQWNRRDITPSPPNLTIRSDASLQGWGAVCNGIRTGGHWSIQERTLHINSLELLAGAFAVKAFTKQRGNIQVLLQIDNSTAVAYVNKMGGTHSLGLSLQACQLW